MFVSAPAQASDCTFGICGVVYNSTTTGTEVVAASLDYTGGTCAPYGNCGTCAVPPGQNSRRAACAAVFADADVFTFQFHSYKVYAWVCNKVCARGSLLASKGANQYFKISSTDSAICYYKSTEGYYCHVN
ncbi:hypothetical protein [Rhizocola hellebori]|uniref:hypothetical protein n=1 Tax=Rhizocola hellebori TaxID=1392758 RepID=UPI00194551C2|nr:hypothetical protein [Rhizocola hellebori]